MRLRRDMDCPGVNNDGSLKTPAYLTVFFNRVLVQNHFESKGQMLYIGNPFYKISFRNIWVRELN